MTIICDSVAAQGSHSCYLQFFIEGMLIALNLLKIYEKPGIFDKKTGENLEFIFSSFTLFLNKIVFTISPFKCDVIIHILPGKQ